MLEAKQPSGGGSAAATEPGHHAAAPVDFQQFWKNAWRPSHDVGSYRMTRVEGEIPRELHGTLYRNGPSQNIKPTEGFAAMHLFEGDALIHAFRFDDGRVDYTGRFVENPTHLAEKRLGRVIGGLGESNHEPDDLGEVVMRQQPNTNVVYHGGKLLALVENAWPFEIDARDLSPIGTNDFQGRMLGMSTTAHPKIDRKTGQMIIHGYQPFEPYAQYYELDADGICTVAEPLDFPYVGMCHDMAITENYAIIPLGAITLHGEKLMSGEATVDECLRWEPDKGIRFALRPRGAGGDIRWFQAPAGYMFHPGNAYEEDGKIFMDACVYEDGGQLIEGLRLFRQGRGVGLRAVPYLYEFDLTTGECKATKLDDRGAEFPRLDDRLVGYKNRFGYAWRQDYAADAPKIYEIMKYDRQGGLSTAHDFGAWQWPGEAVFVPRTPTSDEDDGFLLCTVYDGTTDGSYLAVLDARNMADEPLAKVHLEHRIPLGFHGNFAGAVV